jgi:hypothetical protein
MEIGRLGGICQLGGYLPTGFFFIIFQLGGYLLAEWISISWVDSAGPVANTKK